MKINFKIVLLTLTLICLTATPGHAQGGAGPTPRLKFEHLSVEEGLGHAVVYAILQDSRGLMWFGTENGLTQYDGAKFTIYRPDPDNPHSLGGSRVAVLREDQAGNLWIGTLQASGVRN